MISRRTSTRLFTVAMFLFYRSVAVCNDPSNPVSLGNPKIPSTLVFSETPLEKVVYDAGPHQSLTGTVSVAVGQMSRPEVARTAGRAISKKMFISGLRNIYGVDRGNELVLEGLSVGKESYGEGLYVGIYTIPLGGVKLVKPVTHSPLEAERVGGTQSTSLGNGTRDVLNSPAGLVKKPSWVVDPKVLEFTNLQSSSVVLLRAEEKLQHEFECCSLAVESVFALMQSETGVTYETAAVDLKELTESFKAKIAGELLFSRDEKAAFSKRIDALADSGYQKIVELIK